MLFISDLSHVRVHIPSLQEKFRTNLLHSAEDFKKTVSNMVEDFETKGPFTAAVPIVDAMEFISSMRAQLAQLKIQEAGIRKGLNIFKIDQPPSHLIQTVEKVLIQALLLCTLILYKEEDSPVSFTS